MSVRLGLKIKGRGLGLPGIHVLKEKKKKERNIYSNRKITDQWRITTTDVTLG